MLDPTVFNKIRAQAAKLGIDAIGATHDFKPKHADYFLDWLKQGLNGDMAWLAKNTDKRLNPDTILPGTKSVIVCACSYNHEPQDLDFKIARYAHGTDYHLWMKEKLEALAQFIRDDIASDLVYRSFVDTGPVLERDLAAKAGLGWVGKNTCLINPELGSFVFLGVIFSNLELDSFAPQKDLCGTCRLCLDACPTAALTPYKLDATKCLSYHNIEKRGERDEDFAKHFGEWLVGCDICQEVCPVNHRAPDSNNESWRASFESHEMASLSEWENLSKKEYQEKFKDSAISRIRFEDMMRNLEILNSK